MPEGASASTWTKAAEILMLAAEGKAPLMVAHIGMLKALHVGKHLARFI